MTNFYIMWFPYLWFFNIASGIFHFRAGLKTYGVLSIIVGLVGILTEVVYILK